MNIRNVKAGFSMIEIMIAIAVIGILAITVGPGAFRMLSGSKVSAAKSALAGMKAAVTAYYQDMQHYPKDSEGGLEALVQRPKSDKKNKWDGSYLSGMDEVPEDPWGNEYVYNTGKNIVFPSKYKAFEILTWSDGEEGDTAKALTVGE